MKNLPLLKLLALALFVFYTTLAFAQNPKTYTQVEKDSLRKRYNAVYVTTFGYDLKRQQYLDSLSMIMPNSSEVWKFKATPCFKTGKYDIGMEYLDKAVALDEKEYINYRAFIKCIFTKQHREAIVDLKRAKVLLGEQYTMDHPNNFWISICYLQMNQMDSAKIYMERCTKWEQELKGEGKEHPLNHFYMGIIAYENHQNEEAIRNFDKILAWYERFSDAKYYKGRCLERMGKKEEADALYKSALADIKVGYTIVEDNVIYEQYPYQIRQSWLER